MSYSLELKSVGPKAGDPPGSALSHIYIKHNHGTDKDGDIIITADCFGLSAMEREIDRLIEELKDIREKAKRLYKK